MAGRSAKYNTGAGHRPARQTKPHGAVAMVRLEGGDVVIWPAELYEMLSDGSPIEVAAKIGVHNSTVYRWLKTPEYLAYAHVVSGALQQRRLATEISDFEAARDALRERIADADPNIALQAVRALIALHNNFPGDPRMREAAEREATETDAPPKTRESLFESLVEIAARDARPSDAPEPVESNV